MPTKLGTAYVTIEGDWSKFNRQLATNMRGLGKGIDLDPRSIKGFDKLEGSIRGARDEADGLASSTRGIQVDRSAERNVNGLGRALNRSRGQSEGLHGSLLRAKLVLGLMAVPDIASGLSAGAAGAVALTSALSPLAGSLAAIPALASTAGQSIATAMLATQGVGGAIKDAFTAQGKAGQDAAKSMGDVAAKAETLRSAENAVAQANRQQTYDRQSLTEAVAASRREYQDLRDAVADTGLSEEKASQALTRAKRELAKAERSGASNFALDEARTNVADAAQGLHEARESHSRATTDYAKAEKTGVKGMPQVVQARRQLADSTRAVAEAEHQVGVAQRQMASSGAKASASVSKLSQDMAGLSPEAQAFVRHIIGLKPAFDGLRASAGRDLFPSLSKGIDSASANLPVLDRLLEKTGGSLGRVAEDAGKLAGSKGFGRDLETIGTRNAQWTEELGGGLIHVLSGVRHLTVASGPFTGWLVKTADAWAENFDATQKLNRENGKTAAYLERTRAVMERLWSISTNLAGAFKAIGRAATPLGDDMWKSIDRGTRRFEDWSKSAKGQNSLRKWFADARTTAHDMGEAIKRAADRFKELKAGGRSTFDALTIMGSEAFADFLSHASERIAREAPTIAEGFVRGFLTADVWGKLAIGGYLLTRFRLWPRLFAAMGSRNGLAFAKGFEASSVVAAATPVAATVAKGTSAGGVVLPQGQLKGRTSAEMALPPKAAAAGKVSGFLRGLAPFAKQAGMVGLGFAAIDGLGAAFGQPGAQASTLGKLRNFTNHVMGTHALGLTKDVNEKYAAARKGILGGNLQAALAANKVPRTAVPNAKTDSVEWKLDLSDFNKSTQLALRKLIGLRRQADRVLGKDVHLKVDLDSQVAQAAMATLTRNFRAMRTHTTTSVRGLERDVDANTRAIAKVLGANSADGRRAMARNFNLAVDDIKSMMHDGLVTADQGSREIRKLMVKYLSSFGLSAKDANFSIKSRGTAGAARHAEAIDNGGTIRGNPNRAKGGLTGFGTPGAKGRDTIPANIGGQNVMVGSGEVAAVFNRHQLPEINARLSDQGGLSGFFKRNRRPHYAAKGGTFGGTPKSDNRLVNMLARGGSVDGTPMAKGGMTSRWDRLITAMNDLASRHLTYQWGGGHVDPSRGTPSFDCSGMVSYAVQHAGYKVPTTVSGNIGSWGFPAGPGRATIYYNPTHTFMGTSDGRQWGSNWMGWGGGHPTAAFKAVHLPGLGDAAGALAMDGATAPKIARQVVQGPDGAPKAMVQRALDVARAAAQRKVSAAAASVSGVDAQGSGGLGGIGDVGSVGDTANKKQLASLWVAAGGPRNVANIAGAIAMAESTGRRMARNPSGASGFWQILGQVVPGDIFEPMINAKNAVKKYEDAGNSFNPWVQYTTGAYRKFLARGGLLDAVPDFATGGRTAANKTAATGKADKNNRLVKLLQRSAHDRDHSATEANARKMSQLAKNLRLRNVAVNGAQAPATLEQNIGKFTGLENWIEDENSLFGSDTQMFNLDDVLTQDEVNQLVNRAGGIRGAYATELNLVRDSIVPDTSARLAAARKKAAQMTRRVKALLAAIKRAQAESEKIARRETAEAAAFRKIKKPSKTQREARARSKDANARKRSQLAAEVAGYRTEIGTLTGDKDFSDATQLSTLSDGGGTLGATQKLRDDYQSSLDSDPGWVGKLRPSQIPASIRDWDFTIAELIKNGATKPDNTDGEAAASERADLLQGLLNESNLRTIVSDRQFAVLRDTPRYGGTFHTGGIVPGPKGEDRTTILQSGEGVFTRDQMAAMGSGGDVQVVINVHKDAGVDPTKIEAVVQKVNRREARSVGRTPALAGSLLG